MSDEHLKHFLANANLKSALYEDLLGQGLNFIDLPYLTDDDMVAAGIAKPLWRKRIIRHIKETFGEQVACAAPVSQAQQSEEGLAQALAMSLDFTPTPPGSAAVAEPTAEADPDEISGGVTQDQSFAPTPPGLAAAAAEPASEEATSGVASHQDKFAGGFEGSFADTTAFFDGPYRQGRCCHSATPCSSAHREFYRMAAHGSAE